MVKSTSPKRVRLADVALAANTSIKTVSRVLNNDVKVSDETRERVQKKINELGYQVDIIARSLRTGVDKVIGVVVQKISDPFFAEIIEGVEKYANEKGISVIVGSTHGQYDRENELVQGFIQRRVAGMIVTPQKLDYSFLKEKNFPTVFIDRSPNKYKADVVRIDDEYGAKIVTNHLINQGHKRIAYFTDDLKIKTSQLRFTGYKAALQDAGIKFDDKITYLKVQTNENLDKVLTDLMALNNPPTAIFSSNAETSIYLVVSIHKMELIDIAFVSFDEFTLAASVQPSITVLDHSAESIAREATLILFEKIDGIGRKPRDYIIPLKIVPRGSGEVPVRINT